MIDRSPLGASIVTIRTFFKQTGNSQVKPAARLTSTIHYWSEKSYGVHNNAREHTLNIRKSCRGKVQVIFRAYNDGVKVPVSLPAKDKCRA